MCVCVIITCTRLKTECGCPSSEGIKNGHIRYPSYGETQKFVYKITCTLLSASYCFFFFNLSFYFDVTASQPPENTDLTCTLWVSNGRTRRNRIFNQKSDYTQSVGVHETSSNNSSSNNISLITVFWRTHHCISGHFIGGHISRFNVFSDHTCI